MIVDKIDKFYLYSKLSESIAKAFTLLKDIDFVAKADGKYSIDGDNLFYIVQRYETKPFAEGQLEAHKKYIDIQYIVTGEEVFGHAFLENLQIEKPYDEKKDVAFYKVPEKVNSMVLKHGMFCIFFPHDTHMPCRQLNGSAKVLKVVVKVKLEENI